MPLSWQNRLDSASTEGEVVDIAKDFMAQFDRHEIQQLPEACRPGKFFDANDVTTYAFALVRRDCGAAPETAEMVHRLAGFFSNASIRLSQLMACSNPSRNESRQSA